LGVQPTGVALKGLRFPAASFVEVIDERRHVSAIGTGKGTKRTLWKPRPRRRVQREGLRRSLLQFLGEVPRDAMDHSPRNPATFFDPHVHTRLPNGRRVNMMSIALLAEHGPSRQIEEILR